MVQTFVVRYRITALSDDPTFVPEKKSLLNETFIITFPIHVFSIYPFGIQAVTFYGLVM